MAYPSFKQQRQSQKQPESGIVVTTAPDGEFHTATNFGREDPAQFTVVHHLTAAQVATLEAAYAAHIQAVPIVAESFTWDEDSTSHSVFYAGPPQVEWLANDLYRAVVQLRRVITTGSALLENFDILLLESGDEVLLENG